MGLLSHWLSPADLVNKIQRGKVSVPRACGGQSEVQGQIWVPLSAVSPGNADRGSVFPHLVLSLASPAVGNSEKPTHMGQGFHL